MGLMDKAVRDLDKSVSLEGSGVNPDTLSMLATLKEQLGDFKASLELFQRVVQLRPDDASTHYNLALALGKQGKIIEAIDHFTTSIKLNPNLREAYLKRGIAYEFMGARQAARSDFARALSMQVNELHGFSPREPVYLEKVKETVASMK
jgi:Flp pilus assembly protein TadD